MERQRDVIDKMDWISKMFCSLGAQMNIVQSMVPGNTGKRLDYLQWNDYFMALAKLSSERSKDPVTQVGACIVDNNNRLIAIGYNGFPRKCHDDVFSWRKMRKIECATVVEQLNDKNMYVVHAEANAILNKNCMDLKNSRLYTTLFPCNECAKLIIQSGIGEIYYISDKNADRATYRASKRMFDAVGVIYKCLKPSKEQIILNFRTSDIGSNNSEGTQMKYYKQGTLIKTLSVILMETVNRIVKASLIIMAYKIGEYLYCREDWPPITWLQLK